MAGTPRRARRMVVLGTVLALGAWLGAAPIDAQDNAEEGNGAEEKSSADEPLGVAVPGLTVSAVSGEAFGGEAELFVRFQEIDGAGALVDTQALVDALATHDVEAVGDVLQAAGVDVSDSKALTVVTLSGEEGPEPEVELPPTGGGPIEDSESALEIELTGSFSDSVTIAEDLEVVTEGWPGETGWSRSEASAEEVFGDLSGADKVDSECSADLSGVRGSTDIDDGVYVDEDLDDEEIPEHPEPNEELVDLEIDDHGTVDGAPATAHIEGSVVVNEQDEDESSITVTGLVERFEIVVFLDSDPSTPVFEERFEMRIAQSHCDIHPDPVLQVVEPTFTG